VTPSIEETGWGEFHMFKVILKVKPEGRVELMEFKYLGVQI
jgi:transcription initiation factor IIF auxiliary subunit